MSRATAGNDSLTSGSGAIRPAAPYAIGPGRPHPLGATVDAAGVNFSFFSQHATGIELLLFDEHDDPEPIQRIALVPGNQQDVPLLARGREGPEARHALRLPRGRPVGRRTTGTASTATRC